MNATVTPPQPDAIQAAYRTGDLGAALAMTRRWLQQRPDDPAMHNFAAVIAAQSGKLADAVSSARTAARLDPVNVGYSLNLAMMLEQSGEIAEAMAINESILQAAPGHAGALFNLGNLAHVAHRYDDALDYYQRAHATAPGRTDILANLAAQKSQRHDHAGAIEDLTRATTLTPGDSDLWTALGNAHASAGDSAAAHLAFERALALRPGDLDALANDAIEQLRHADHATALARVTELDRWDPGNRTAVAIRCIAAAQSGDQATLDTLLDYDTLLQVSDCDAAEGYATLDDFHRALSAHVLAHPTLQFEPASKTTRGGSQSANLLRGDPGPVRLLERLIRGALEKYLQSDKFARLPGAGQLDEWDLNVWATILDRDGRQLPHIHPAGLLSGVYYVAVAGDGAIEFGQPPADFGPFAAEKRLTIAPEAGRMIVFPSYVYHQTVAYAGDGQRISIAFDLVPRSRAQPGHGPALLRHVAELRRTGRLKDARDALRRLLEDFPGYAPGWLTLGQLYVQTGDHGAAVAALSRAAQLAPGDAAAQLALGRALQRQEDYPAARAAYRRCLALAPNDAEALMALASVYTDLGDSETAIRHYLELLATHPDSGRAWYGIALLKTFAADDPYLIAMEACAQRDDLSQHDRSSLHFALGRAYEQTGDYDRAFDNYRSGNAIKRAAQPFDARQDAANAKRIRRAFTPALFAARRDVGVDDQSPVFIVGMPRSGSTLVEQIIASHPDAYGAGEINALWQTLSRAGPLLPRGARLPEAVADVAPAGWRTLGEHYVKTLRQLAGSAAHRITDKLPFNYTLIGLIQLMLPGAHIIDCRRHPLDACVSCYTTSFGSDRGFTNDLADLGATWRTYSELMAHWDSVLPGRVLRVNYEALIADTEGQSRAVIAHLGLPWSERCLDFHRHRRAVTTASHAQVRQPIYTSSLNRWRRFDTHLEPLRAALGDALQTGGDTHSAADRNQRGEPE